MIAYRSGSVVGGKIELDEPTPQELEGKRVTVAVEVIDDEDDPVARAFKDAPLDDFPMTAEERAAIEKGKREGKWVSHEEVGAKLAARKRSG